jgi:hypothetical protein
MKFNKMTFRWMTHKQNDSHQNEHYLHWDIHHTNAYNVMLHSAEYLFAKCRSVKCSSAECRGAFLKSQWYPRAMHKCQLLACLHSFCLKVWAAIITPFFGAISSLIQENIIDTVLRPIYMDTNVSYSRWLRLLGHGKTVETILYVVMQPKEPRQVQLINIRDHIRTNLLSA